MTLLLLSLNIPGDTIWDKAHAEISLIAKLGYVNESTIYPKYSLITAELEGIHPHIDNEV